MSKKTESIEFRLSPELKEDLARRSASEGQTMSGYLRDLVADDMTGGVLSAKGDPVMTKLFPKSVTRFSLMALPALLLAGGYMISAGMVAQASPEARMTFAEMDVNGDGLISEEEFFGYAMGDMDEAPALPAACAGTDIAKDFETPTQDFLREELGLLDANADKSISFDELAASIARDKAEMFLEADLDGNGFVTAEEMVQVTSDEGMSETETKDVADELGITVECLAALDEQDLMDDQELVLESDEAIDDAEMARLMIAEFDENRDGRLTLTEVLSH
ncbi:hypothetical protein [Aliiroseovarius crassostreae]|uniref:hypothetical protein n=1 Tax=Aliiroseovarius crassostreae TaxID=154981 RepID=UPI003C7B7E86